MNDLGLPTDFQHKLRAQVLGAMVDMIPEDKFVALVDAAVSGFFDANASIEIEHTTIQVKDPRYDPDNRSYHAPKEMMSVGAWVFKNRMSPFTQMIWTMLHEYCDEKVKAHFEDKTNELRAEFDKYFEEKGAEVLDKNYDTKFAALVQVMSGQMFSEVVNAANSVSIRQTVEMLKRSSTLDGRPLGIVMRDAHGNPI